MSKSLKRIKSALSAAGTQIPVIETGAATTALAAAKTLGCHIDQIAKSIIFEGSKSLKLYLFVTAGSKRVSLERAALLTGEPTLKAGPENIRRITGFAIGGVSIVGHLSPITTFFDAYLMLFPIIYAAAGTPYHVFGCMPQLMQSLCRGKLSHYLKRIKYII